MLKYAVALVIAGSVGVALASTQEPQGCQNGPSQPPAQRERRQASIRYTRQVNTAASAIQRRAGRFPALADIPDLPPVPDGFNAQFSTDGTTYGLSVKDSLDACPFALFSDQNGVIYMAEPIRNYGR